MKIYQIYKFICLNIVLYLIFCNTKAFPSDSNKNNPRLSFKEYEEARKKLISSEDQVYLGHELPLTEDERTFNRILMDVKDREIDKGYRVPRNFTGARHFFHALDKINESKVFKLIQKMPKGGVLHAHDTALLSTDNLMKFLDWENLWICEGDSGIRFWFARTKEAIQKECLSSDQPLLSWVKVKKKNSEKLKTRVKQAFTLFTDRPEIYTDIKEVWDQFLNKFFAIEGLVGYVEAWKEYFKQTLIEFQNDGVQYLEFRGLLPPVYDLDGKFLTKSEIVKTYTDVLDEFVKLNPDFIGAKFIYAPLRFVNSSGIEQYRKEFTELKEKFPKFIAGFDLVGPEETPFPLKKVYKELDKFPKDTNFFFHAGETNWNGLDVDENLIDAILLGTKRIGHGFAIVKHPKLLAEVKARDIAIEVCPVSNQVLKLVEDHRNHPASILFSDDHPVVVSSDDPSLWQATPLSHDFYLAFMGIANTNASVRFLKKLAINSLKYSALNERELEVAMDKWKKKWDAYIKDVVKKGDNWFKNMK